MSPRGLPPWPASALPRYAALASHPQRELWKGLTVHRPRFLNLPGTGGRFHARAIASSVAPLLAEIRREFRFDVICAEFFFPDGPAAVMLGKRFGVPVSIKARGSDIHDWGRREPTRSQVIAAGNAADGLLAVSQAMRDDMIAMGMPPGKIETIATGVDLARFAPRDRGLAKAELGVSGPLVVSLGALIPLKGHDIVIDAVAALPGVSLWIAGEGSERKRLEAQIARLGLGDRVRLLGSIPPDRVAAALAAADVMALASEREGLANAWLEAIASGTPVVIPDVGGARQVVATPAAGRIVARTAPAFADAIAGLIATPPPAAETRAVAEPFTWAANSARLRGFLQHIIDQRKSTGLGSTPFPR